jgi:hypothetical protein
VPGHQCGDRGLSGLLADKLGQAIGVGHTGDRVGIVVWPVLIVMLFDAGDSLLRLPEREAVWGAVDQPGRRAAVIIWIGNRLFAVRGELRVLQCTYARQRRRFHGVAVAD